MKKLKKGWRFNGNEINYLKDLLSKDFGAGDASSYNERLENLFAKKHLQKYAITANSGTSTLHMALNAFGVGHGDEVILPALTVTLCGFAIWQCGATPVYADVKKDTFLIDPDDIKKKITKKTKAIMVVHLYGLMADMTSIKKIARDHNLYILEDSAQCFLGRDEKNRISGACSDVGSWSFEYTKHITTGDGGIVTTNNEKLAENMRKFASAGYKNLTAKTGRIRIDRSKFQNPNWFRHEMFGYNYRLSEICAAVGLAQLERLNFFLKKRRLMGNLFLKTLTLSKSDLLIPQITPKKFSHTYYTFACLFNGKKYGIKWEEFRLKFMSFGGDGIYAAWKLVSDEKPFKDGRLKGLKSGSMQLTNSYGWGLTPVAKKLQKNLMQFTTNQNNKSEMSKQINALKKTLAFFKKKTQ